MTKSSFVTPVAPISRINVTPIIDVALVLVIILLITAPMLAVTDKTLKLPEASARAGDPDSRIFVTLGSDGALGVDEKIVRREALRNEIVAKLDALVDDDPVVVIRADQVTSYAAVREVLDVVRAAGAARIAVATRPEGLR